MQGKSRFLTAFLILILFPFGSVMAEKLKEGEWQGSLVNSLGKRYKLKYIIRYNNEEEGKVLKIELINLDLKPMPKYTYNLADIKQDKNELNFKIPREHDMRKCTLTNQEDGSYTGVCKSTKATEGEESQISMKPVPEPIPIPALREHEQPGG